MNEVVVLNFLYKPIPYDAVTMKRAEYWIDFFHKKGMHVIGTPPIEREKDLARHGSLTLIPVRSFDTCDRWLAGLSKAIEKFDTDYFFLWSADFMSQDENKDSSKAASSLIDYEGKEDLVVGTIEATGMKEAIDRYGTYPLLHAWFPEEFNRMVQEGLSKPRSELLRFSRKFLKAALQKRWYPAAQTIYLILQCFWNEDYTVKALELPRIPDDPSARSTLNVVAQVDRMELWLRYIWRERIRGWLMVDYIEKCRKSFEIRERAYNALEAFILNETSFQPRNS